MVERRLRVPKEKLASIPKLAARQIPGADIADILGLELEVVLATLANKP